jgi:purine-binding chemotaxis protein CheW
MMRETTMARTEQNRSAPRTIGLDESSRGSWLLCRAGAMLCALPIEHVIEIMRPLPIEQIAGAPKYVLGLSVVRGAPVAVVDLGLVTGCQTTHCTRLIAVKAAERTIALAVGAVIGITAIAADAYGEFPPLLRDAAADTVAAIGALDSQLIVFLRAARLLPAEVLARLDANGGAS